MVVLNNLFCATQDVAIDSLAVSTLLPDERARGNGFMFAGQYLGIALGGGGAVAVDGLFGFEAALAGVAGLLCVMLLFVVFFVRDPFANPAVQAVAGVFRRSVDAMVSFVGEVYASFWRSGRGPMVGVAFSLLPVGAMALAYGTLNTIQVDYGLQSHQIAALSVYNTLAAALGCIAGGVLGDRYGTKPVVVHGMFFGMAFGVRNAIFMGLTNPAVAATQFTAFMGMANFAISFGNYWQGHVAERMGYAAVLYLDALFALLAILVIPFLRGRGGRSV
jgi:PAT family beta-lactamase induction signal transducer AmpG